ncbi:uncharacterized protein V2V93DRAFT_221757 [Kockiozyma suomiensis]|uniref:uncharacterized protein n=1 Tax=Kockiozyma suomiensis TaxID=1337062 RepID=UPI0033441B6F
MFVMLLCFDAVFGSAVVTDDLEAVAEHFNVYLEEVILAVTLFVIGFGTAKKFMNSFVWSNRAVSNKAADLVTDRSFFQEIQISIRMIADQVT